MRTFGLAVFLTGFLVSHPGLFAAGMLLPRDESLPALGIKHQRVDIAIVDGVATTRLEQVFLNTTDRDLEAVYLFPLPADASIAEFAMTIAGKRVAGELVEKDKARAIYQDIVRRLRDPGLLEYMDEGRLLRASVFPVPRRGEQRIELAYSQTLPVHSGLFEFVYPLRTNDEAARTIEDFTVRASVRSTTPLRTVYSPSHQVSISRKGDKEAVIGFEETRSLLDRDFTLYYGVSEKDLGLNMLAHRPAGADAGFFMLMIAPTAAADLERVVPKDVIFVMDTSGSMAGEKIVQARKALEVCVRKLNDGDRYAIVRFSTDVEALSDELLKVDAGNLRKVEEAIRGMQARGGTDIDAALQRALAFKTERDRPCIVAFITDGMPTVGVTDGERIIENVRQALGANTRVFTFGVGHQVNTHLLDRLAGQSGGASQYLRPEQDIEVAVSAFVDRISHPVLTKPALDIAGIKTRDVYPRELPDIFRGGQLLVFGRYEGSGHVAIRLRGEVEGKSHEFVHEATFPEKQAENEFIPRLWATRKVGHLLEAIRLHGEDKELKDEVIRLSREYGIMTPYTSFLVVEDGQPVATRPLPPEPRPPRPPWPPHPIPGPPPHPMPYPHLEGRGATDAAEPAAMPGVPLFYADDAATLGGATGAVRTRVARASEQAVSEHFRRETGAEAVGLSQAISAYKESATAAASDVAGVRVVARRVFHLVAGVWIDRDYRETMKTTRLAYGSAEYFAFIEQHPELKPCFALGPQVIIGLADGSAVAVE